MHLISNEFVNLQESESWESSFLRFCKHETLSVGVGRLHTDTISAFLAFNTRSSEQW